MVIILQDTLMGKLSAGFKRRFPDEAQTLPQALQ